MKKLLLLLFIFCLFGCRTVKESSKTETKEFRGIKETEINKHYESLYFGIIDSLRRVKAPAENSNSYGKKYSFLQTSLAWSTASLDSLGVLTHEIGNKDSIDAKIRHISEKIYIHDTVYSVKKDSAYSSSESEMIKVVELSRWQQIVLGCGYGAIFSIFIFVVVVIVTVARKFRQ